MAAVAVAALGASSEAQAASYAVTNLNDAGSGSLRQAILDANANPGADTIGFARGLTGSISLLSEAPLELTDPVSIVGPGASKLEVLNSPLRSQVPMIVCCQGSGSSAISGLTIRGGSAPHLFGGAISTGGELRLERMSFKDNTATMGGAIANSGRLTVVDSSFSGNHATTFGSTIWNTGNATFSGTTFADDGTSSTVESDSGLVTLANSTMVGGGVETWQGGNAVLANDTITDGFLSDDQSGGPYLGPHITVSNTILLRGFCSPLAVDNGHNLSTESGCPGNHADPMLGPLQDNGGPTPTMAPAGGSPAIDAGDDAICAGAPVNNVDQRGATRPQGPHCDIGAYEAPAVKLIGERDLQPSVDFNPAGLAEAFAFPASKSGTLNALTIYLDSTSTATTVVVGLYTTNPGHPGTLLTQSTLLSPVAGTWNTVAVPAVPLVDGTKYWLAVLGVGGTVKFRDNCCGATGTRNSETSQQTNLLGLPTTWATGKKYRMDGPASFYGSGQA